MNRRICYYHAGCTDGFGAAWAIHHWVGDFFEYRPLQYGDPFDLDAHAGDEVVFVDVSLKARETAALARTARCVTVLDHHTSAVRELQPLLDQGTIYGILDLTRSGALLAWDWAKECGHLGDDRNPPQLLRYIQDRDLWQKEFEFCDEVALWIRSYPFDFRTWNRLANDLERHYQAVIEEALAIKRYHDRLVDPLCERCRTVEIAGYRVPVVNAPGVFASEVAGRLAEGNPFAAVYFDTPDKRVYSLRSTPDGLDVSRIAELLGGGGHPHAAGFTLPLDEALDQVLEQAVIIP